MTPLQLASFATVFIAWASVGVALIARGRQKRGAQSRRDSASLIGLTLQGVGFALVFSVQCRWTGTHAPEFLRAAAAIVLSGLAVVTVVTAVRVLGRQWSLAARVLEDHALITTGPYAFVRHPIYAGLFGLLLATGLTLSRLVPTVAGAGIYVLGTLLRTSREERLLRQSFERAYEDYARRVPALLPGLRARRGNH